MIPGVYLYQNMVCPHEADLLRALAAVAGAPVTWVVDAEVLPYRARMGVSRPDCGAARVIVTTEEARVRRIVAEAPPDAIHIVQGPRGGVCSRAAWRACLATDRRVGLYSEPADPRGLKGFLRRWLYTAEYLQWGRRLQFVLATGQLGIDWYTGRGYPARRLFPFCYVTQPPAGPAAGAAPADGVFRVVYCGQLIARKRVDLLLRALARLPAGAWFCTIIGDGPLEVPLRSLALAQGLAERIDWRGVLPNSEAQNVVRACDLLVLPSAFDGWGAVVSEALSVGTPAVCSDACGSAELLREAWRGGVFRSGSVPALAAELARRLAAGPVTAAARARIAGWARACIAGEPVAQYFLAVMAHVYQGAPRPAALWRLTDPAARSAGRPTAEEQA